MLWKEITCGTRKIRKGRGREAGGNRQLLFLARYECCCLLKKKSKHLYYCSLFNYFYLDSYFKILKNVLNGFLLLFIYYIKTLTAGQGLVVGWRWFASTTSHSLACWICPHRHVTLAGMSISPSFCSLHPSNQTPSPRDPAMRFLHLCTQSVSKPEVTDEAMSSEHRPSQDGGRLTALSLPELGTAWLGFLGFYAVSRSSPKHMHHPLKPVPAFWSWLPLCN